jgi:hypothetical protein
MTAGHASASTQICLRAMGPAWAGLYTPELLERHIGMGVQLILSGSDFSLLMQAGTARAALVRGFEKK